MKKTCIGTVSVFSLLSALMAATMLVLVKMIENNKIEESLININVIRVSGYVILIASMAISAIAVVNFKQYDDYQLEKACKWRIISKSIALIFAVVSCIIGVVISNMGTMIYIMLMGIWIVILVEILAEIKLKFNS
ncbi:MAG: hypothetical protein IK014_03490 [Lachnospiraceae bacterium]|nr:hypothetical protein [Lachnospiraceae bacterium]